MAYGEIQKEIKGQLRFFWERFGGIQNNGEGYLVEEKLDMLIHMSQKLFFRRTSSLARYRKHFNENYKGLWRMTCFVCGKKSQHRHHIIQLQNGGINSKFNRLPLCVACHRAIHSWMN